MRSKSLIFWYHTPVSLYGLTGLLEVILPVNVFLPGLTKAVEPCCSMTFGMVSLHWARVTIFKVRMAPGECGCWRHNLEEVLQMLQYDLNLQYPKPLLFFLLLEISAPDWRFCQRTVVCLV